MNVTPNPFIRGYTQFNIGRVLLITSDDDTRLRYRPLHSLQAEFPDSQLEGSYCHFGNDFALIPERQQLPEDLIRQCPHRGFILNVLRSITAEQAGTPVHVGDLYSTEAAQEVVRQLRFDTGHYSRCWEVSTKHLTPTSLRWLECCAEGPPPPGVLFQAFHIPGSRGAIGVRFQATPWTDAHLSDVLGFDTGYLRQAQELAKMPPSLIDVLHRAALADTRIVVFDPIAPVLQGLLLHD